MYRRHKLKKKKKKDSNRKEKYWFFHFSILSSYLWMILYLYWVIVHMMKSSMTIKSIKVHSRTRKTLSMHEAIDFAVKVIVG